jgi:putative acetyltransferase
MGVRDAAATDHAAIGDVVTRAFGDDGATVAALVDDLRASGHVRAELVADADGRVAGHVMLSRSWVDARRSLVDVLVLSPLSVAPERHGQGLGTALLAAAVERARRLGAPALFLEGDPGFYAGRGFEPATPRGFVRPSPRIPEPAFQVVVLEPHEPWMTGPLVYCDPFWARDCVGLRDSP